MADVNFPVDHPQYLGDFDPSAASAKKSLKDVDVLVAVGCSVFAESFFDPEAPTLAGIKIVHIDDDPWEIGKNYPGRLRSAGRHQGHAGRVERVRWTTP